MSKILLCTVKVHNNLEIVDVDCNQFPLKYTGDVIREKRTADYKSRSTRKIVHEKLFFSFCQSPTQIFHGKEHHLPFSVIKLPE